MSEPTTPFETIRKTDEGGNEYWNARDLARVLDYGEFRFFKNVIKKAEAACENSGQVVADQREAVGVIQVQLAGPRHGEGRHVRG